MRGQGRRSVCVPPATAFTGRGLFTTHRAAVSIRWAPSCLGQARGERPLGVGIVIHSGAVADMQTANVDALVARNEQQGLLPIVFWFNGADPRGLGRSRNLVASMC